MGGAAAVTQVLQHAGARGVRDRDNRGDQVVVRIRAAEVSGLDVLSVPAGGFGDGLITMGAFARLLFVKVRQQTSSGKFLGHFSTDATLKVQFIFRIIRIRPRFDAFVAFHLDRR
jgi:hypothetical protein